jgi:hypothetical protein
MREEVSARDPLPLHNHEDYLRFPSPVVPSNSELDILREDLRLFLKGVAFGILQRRNGPGAPYQIDMSVNDWQSVGAERTIRRKRFDGVHRVRLEHLVNRFEDGLTPTQIFAVAILFDWTSRRAYAPRLERSDYDKENRLPGLTNKVALDLSNEYLARFNALKPPPKFATSLDDARDTLLLNMDVWTQVIADSLDDVEGSEANRDLTDPSEVRAESKRGVKAAGFTDGALLELLTPSGKAPPPPPGASIPPPPAAAATVSFYVALDGSTQGPFDFAELRGLKSEGRLSPQSQVYDVSTNGPWKQAADEPALSMLFSAPPPPPPAPAPPGDT